MKMFRQVLLILALCGVAVSPSFAGDWPQFKRTPDRQGCNLQETVSLPAKLCLWEYFGSPIQASPAVCGGKAYAISTLGRIAKIDLASRHVDWWKDLGGYGNESSPAVGNGNVYVGNTNDTFYVLDTADGRVKKTYSAGAPIFAAPLLLSSGVYFGSFDGRFHALDLNGNLKWVYTQSEAIVHSAAAYKGQIVLVHGDHIDWLTDNTTGYTLVRKILDQKCNLSGCAFQSPPMIWRDTIFAGRGEAELTGQYNGLTFYNFNTGIRGDSAMGSAAIAGSEDGFGAPTWACPSVDTSTGVLYNGGGYFGLWSMNDRGRQIRAAYGQNSPPPVTSPNNWATISDYSKYNGIYGVNSSPAVAANCVIFGSESCMVHFYLKTGPTLGGTQTWSFKPITNKPFSSSPAVSDGRVVIGGTDGFLYGFWNGTSVIGPDSIGGGITRIRPTEINAGLLTLNVYVNQTANGVVTIYLNALNSGDAVYLYGVTGALVQKWIIANENSRRITWSGVDIQGRRVAAGTFLAVVRDKKGIQQHSFMVNLIK